MDLEKTSKRLKKDKIIMINDTCPINLHRISSGGVEAQKLLSATRFLHIRVFFSGMAMEFLTSLTTALIYQMANKEMLRMTR